MNLDKLLQQGLIINNTWVDGDKASKKSISAIGKKKIRCKNSNIYCLLPNNLNYYQILAIYISELYGDGFYYCPRNEHRDAYYLLIIQDGNVVCETDCEIDQAMLDYFLANKENSKYQQLELIELDASHLNEILDEYEQSKRYVAKKRKRLVILMSVIVFAASLGVLYLIDYFIKQMML